MSWSAGALGSYQECHDRLQTLALDPDVAAAQPPEVNAQVEQARKAALLMLECMDPAGRYTVRLNGHGNPGHVPPENTSRDWIDVQVSQTEPLPEEPALPAPQEVQIAENGARFGEVQASTQPADVVDTGSKNDPEA